MTRRRRTARIAAAALLALAALPAASEAQSTCLATANGRHWVEIRANHTGGTKKIADRVKATFQDNDTLTRAGVCEMAKQNVADGLFGSSGPWCGATGHTDDWEATYKELDRLAQCRSQRTANGSPTLANALPALSLVEGNTATVNLNSHFSDPENETIGYRATLSGRAASFSLSGPLLTVTAAKPGAATITVWAADPHGASASGTISVAVTERIIQGSRCPAPIVFGAGPGACHFQRDPSSTCRADPDMTEAEWPADWGDPPPWPSEWKTDGTGVTVPAGRIGPLHAYLSCYKHLGRARNGAMHGINLVAFHKERHTFGGGVSPFYLWLDNRQHDLVIYPAGPGLEMFHLQVTRPYYLPDGPDADTNAELYHNYVSTGRFVVHSNTDDWIARLVNEPIKGAKHWDFGRGDGWYGRCTGSRGRPLRVDVSAFHGSITCRAYVGDQVDINFVGIGSNSNFLTTLELDEAKGIVHRDWIATHQRPITLPFDVRSVSPITEQGLTFRPGRSDDEDNGLRTTFRLIVE